MPDLDSRFEALVQKAENARARGENKAAKEYGAQLARLLEAVASGRDAFVNWVAGLATATMLLTFQELAKPNPDCLLFLYLAGASAFLCLICAFAFKILLEVRFSALELEVSLLRVLYEGGNIRAELELMLQRNEPVSDAEKERLLKNGEDGLRFLDPSHIAELRKPIDRKTKWWNRSYWSTLGLFLLSIALVAAHYTNVFFRH